MKADHNLKWVLQVPLFTVSNGSKILKWKQTTTKEKLSKADEGLFPMVQRYLNESRPQHLGYIKKEWALFPMVQRYLNESRPQLLCRCFRWWGTVSNGSKILKWKQTTTIIAREGCAGKLFPMVQRYLNESRPQLLSLLIWMDYHCFQWFKDT